MAFDARADTPADAVAAADKFPFGDVSADGWETITSAKLLKALALTTDDAAGVLGALGVGTGLSLANTGAADVPAGGAVAVNAGGCKPASAATGAAPAVGIAATAAAVGFAAGIRAGGPLTLADWTDATGASALTPNALYFVSPTTAGRITATVPTAGGQVVQKVGRAVSSDTLVIEIEDPILL